jgi:hypothetical protein
MAAEVSPLKQLAAKVRCCWSPPADRAWSPGDVAIVKLLKAIEDAPAEALQRRAELERLFLALAPDLDQYSLARVRARLEEICQREAAK